MRNQLVIVGGMALLLATLFIGYTYMPKPKGSQPTTPEKVAIDQSEIERARANPHFEAIDNMINQMETKAWDKTTYKQIEIAIEAKFSRQLLSLKEKSLLSKKLELVHLTVLKKALKTFFANSRQVSDFPPISQELQRYAKSEYRPNVQDMLKPANDFSSLLRAQRESQRLSATPNVQESDLEKVYQSLLNLENQAHLASSRLAKSISAQSKALLEDKMVNTNLLAMQRPIENYVTTKEYNNDTTSNYLSQLSRLRNHRRIASRSEIRVFCQQAQDDLIGQRNSHERFDSNVNSPSQSCETAFEKYLYYVNKCKQVREANANKQDK